MVTVGSAIGATIPTTFGQTKCNVLIDTEAMKSCMSQAYYQQLMLPATRSIHSFSIKSANGTNLCPIVITECEFKIGTKEYKNDFIVCKKSGTVPMKPENIQSSKQSIPSSHIDTSSESTQAKRRIEAPLLITPKHLGNNIEQQKRIPIKGKNDLKDSNNHR